LIFSQPVRTGALAVACVALTLVSSGCLSSTDAQPSLLRLSGTWSYTGVQTNPVRENLSGTLTISRESGMSFQGRLDMRADNPQTGTNRVLGGLVSGSEKDASVIDFDADVEAVARRHVGEIVADTITGTWVGSSSDGAVISGTFRAEKESQ
jgi:hypothetical protein